MVPLDLLHRKSLFAPLGISDYTWPRDPQGMVHGWGDLRMTAHDMAKIDPMSLPCRQFRVGQRAKQSDGNAENGRINAAVHRLAVAHAKRHPNYWLNRVQAT